MTSMVVSQTPGRWSQARGAQTVSRIARPRTSFPGMSRTVEAYTWIGGFTLTAKTRLVDQLSWCGRDIGWVFDDDSNAVRIGYVGHLLRIECHCHVGGEHAYVLTWGSHSCFDDVAAWSLYNEPVEGSTWGAVKALYLP